MFVEKNCENFELKITIVTVCLNARKTIENTIRSVVEQCYNNIEYIVIDGGSKDGTIEIVERYLSHISYFLSESDSGIYNAMNKGIENANGQYVHFLNSDDFFCDNNVVEDVVESINNNDFPDIVYGDILIDGVKKVSQVTPLTRKKLCNSWICHQAFFAKKETLIRTNGFSEKFKVVSDIDWLAKNLKFGVSYLHIDRDIASVSIEGLSGTSKWRDEKHQYFRDNYSVWEYFLWRKLPRLFKFKK